MGTLDYDALTTEILAALGGRSSFDSDRLLNIVNLAQMRIARVHRWEELEDSTTDTFTITANEIDDKFITMPTGVRDVYTFRVITSDGSSRKLKKRSYRFFDQNIPEPEYYSRGDPTVYCVYSGKAELWRVPETADTYILRHCNWPTAFDGTTSQTSDLDNKDDMLVALATSWAFQTLGRLEDAGRWWTTYSSMLNSAVMEDAENPDQLIAPAFETKAIQGEYWKDPFVERVLG